MLHSVHVGITTQINVLEYKIYGWKIIMQFLYNTNIKIIVFYYQVIYSICYIRKYL